MFLLVNNFILIGMLLNILNGQVPKKLTNIYNKEFPYHSTLINYAQELEYIQHLQCRR